MIKQHVFLVEICVEEMPSKILRRFGESFFENIQDGFKKFNIVHGKVVWFASSRHLAVKVSNILITLEMDDDSVDNQGLSISDTNIVLFNKDFFGEERIISLFGNIVNNALMRFPISTLMRWKDRNIKFVRPVRTVSMLLDERIIPCSFFGLSTCRVTSGHPFMGDSILVLDHAKNYEKILKNNLVIVDYECRRKIVCDGVSCIAKQLGGISVYTESLLEEVSASVEWPVLLFGSFDKSFLCIPYEILLHVITVKKRYFPVYDANGNLLPYFIFVVNIITDNFRKIIIAHERAIHPYFSDAEFFLNCDKECRLENYLPRLHTILFHRKLGSLHDKTIRMKSLSCWLADKIGVDVYQSERAAHLSKCDLLSRMVSEFPFSQGIIGMHYARRDGELEVVALAQKEQYQPRCFSDVLPSTLISCIISIVDKIDTVSGMFIIKEYPKGSGDPMGLRRAALGILRIVIEKKICINLFELIKQSLDLYSGLFIEGCVEKIIQFMYTRLCVLYEKKGYKLDIIRATLHENLLNLENFDERVRAVTSFCKLEDSRLLFSMCKRIFNILIKDISKIYKYEFNDSLLIEKEEIFLAKKVFFLNQELSLMCAVNQYYNGLILLGTLYTPVKNFFDHVVVMSKNDDLRFNRLVLLYRIWELLLKIINTPRHILSTKDNICTR